MAHYEIKPAQARRIQAAFTFHPPKPESDQAARYDAIRGSLLNMAHFLAMNCPDSRELNSALKCLEEAQAWAIAAIARNE